jgi:hypothetical protein
MGHDAQGCRSVARARGEHSDLSEHNPVGVTAVCLTGLAKRVGIPLEKLKRSYLGEPMDRPSWYRCWLFLQSFQDILGRKA